MRVPRVLLMLSAFATAAIADFTPTVLNSSAVNAQDVCPGYKATSVDSSEYGLTAVLELAGKPCNAYGTDIASLQLTVSFQDKHRLSIDIQPLHLDSTNSSYYVLPDTLVPKPSGQVTPHETDMRFSWSNHPTFWFKVSRKSTGEVLFNTKGSKLVFENQFIEFVTQLPTGYNITGIGEHLQPLRYPTGAVSTTWNADDADPFWKNLYGSHPFYLDTRYYQTQNGKTKGSAHGVFWRNSHGLDAIFGTTNLTWRAIGGSVDLYFFDGPTATSAIAQYHEGVIGLPAMQQYWTFGFHQCHWGYHNWSEVAWNVQQFKNSGVPLETVWVDIDYMDQKLDFTTDPVNFPAEEGQTLISQFHADGQHFVPIIDADVWYPGSNTSNYTTYNRGHELGVFLKNPDGSEYVSQAWPGYVVWGDWHHPSANNWWSQEIVDFHSQLDFDGIWIDLSEPSSSCDGSCGNPTPWAGPVPEGERDINNPPYNINNVKGPLSSGTVSTNATHEDGMVEYDVHNLWGHQLLNATHYGLQNVAPKRPFIIGRSTFAGSGQWAGHWGGDNFAAWDDMAYSIPQALTMSMFGIPMFGVDTCGFFWDVSPELCGRWMQLSAFFPFYRNHYSYGSEPHEPWRWPDVAEWSRDTIAIRYSLLPYLYTLFYHASTAGDTVMRAIEWEFPDDSSLAGSDRQFMLGSAIMVLPVLTQGVSFVDGVFPGPAPWYDWYNQTAVPRDWQTQNTTVWAPQGHIPLFVRGGSIVPLQQPANTTRDSRRNPWGVLVALDQHGQASGDLYLDDGESISPSATKMITLTARAGEVTVNVNGNWEPDDGVTPLANVTIMGVKSFNNRPTFNGKRIHDFDYDANKELLQITGLEKITKGGAWENGWVLAWSSR